MLVIGGHLRCSELFSVSYSQSQVWIQLIAAAYYLGGVNLSKMILYGPKNIYYELLCRH